MHAWHTLTVHVSLRTPFDNAAMERRPTPKPFSLDTRQRPVRGDRGRPARLVDRSWPRRFRHRLLILSERARDSHAAVDERERDDIPALLAGQELHQVEELGTAETAWCCVEVVAPFAVGGARETGQAMSTGFSVEQSLGRVGKFGSLDPNLSVRRRRPAQELCSLPAFVVCVLSCRFGVRQSLKLDLEGVFNAQSLTLWT